MIQCKICGTPLGKEPNTGDLEIHWKKHHSWHWGKNDYNGLVIVFYLDD